MRLASAPLPHRDIAVRLDTCVSSLPEKCFSEHRRLAAFPSATNRCTESFYVTRVTLGAAIEMEDFDKLPFDLELQRLGRQCHVAGAPARRRVLR